MEEWKGSLIGGIVVLVFGILALFIETTIQTDGGFKKQVFAIAIFLIGLGSGALVNTHTIFKLEKRS